MSQRNQKTTVTHDWLISNTKRLGHSSAQFFFAFKTPSTSFTPDALATITDAIATDPLGLVCAVCVANYAVWGANNGKPPNIKAARVDVAMLAGSILNAGGGMVDQSAIVPDTTVTLLDNHLRKLASGSDPVTPDGFASALKSITHRVA